MEEKEKEKIRQQESYKILVKLMEKLENPQLPKQKQAKSLLTRINGVLAIDEQTISVFRSDFS